MDERKEKCVGIGSLTPRELEVLELVAEPNSNREVAKALRISVRTVEGHLCLVYRKLGVRTRTAASKIWWEHRNGAGGCWAESRGTEVGLTSTL